MKVTSALAVCTFLVAQSPSYAGCRLSTADCAVISREITSEAVLQLKDEREYATSLKAYPRISVLVGRHYDRLTERARHLPARIAKEQARMDLCDTREGAAASKGETYVPTAECR